MNIMCEVEVQTYLSCQPSGPLPVCSDVNREEEVRHVQQTHRHANNISTTQHLFIQSRHVSMLTANDRNRNLTMEPLSLTSVSADTPLKHSTAHIKCRCEDTEVISGSLCPLDPKHDEINTNSEPSIQTRQLANIQH